MILTDTELNDIANSIRNSGTIPDYLEDNVFLSVKTSNSRDIIENISDINYMDNAALNYINEQNEGIYYVYFRLVLTDEDNRDLYTVAMVDVLLVEYDDIDTMVDTFDHAAIADSGRNCLDLFSHSKEWKKIYDDEYIEPFYRCDDSLYLPHYVGEIHTFYVDPLFRGTGISGKLRDSIPLLLIKMHNMYPRLLLSYVFPFKDQVSIDEMKSKHYSRDDKMLLDIMYKFCDKHNYRTFCDDPNYRFWSPYIDYDDELTIDKGYSM